MSDLTYHIHIGGAGGPPSVTEVKKDAGGCCGEPTGVPSIQEPGFDVCKRIISHVNNSPVPSGVSFTVKFVAPISATPDIVYEIIAAAPELQGDAPNNKPKIEYPSGGIVESTGDPVPGDCNAATHKVYKQDVRMTVRTGRTATIRLYDEDNGDLTLRNTVMVVVVV
jgi:hypothetical protein